MSSNKRNAESEKGGAAKRAHFRGGVDVTSVRAFASRNRKNRYFIPSTNNSVAGISYGKLMVDSGCSSVLLPFPDGGVQVIERKFSPTRHEFTISSSKGTGAIHSLVLKIKSKMSQGFSIVLNGQLQPVSLPFLRFHLGSSAATELEQVDWLDQNCKNELHSFIQSLNGLEAMERQHVLVGQSYISQMFSAQLGDIMIFMNKDTWLNYAANLPDLIATFHDIARPMVERYDGFHDLEDEDHDAGGDEEDVRLSWDSDEECIDELYT
jgi:hypothetical protein